MNPQITKAIAAIPEDTWTPITYPAGGEAQVAETTYVTGRRGHERVLRLVVRRTRLTDPHQAQLWPDWRHHAFVTNVELPTVEVDQFHRAHATIELAIRDIKNGAGLAHLPSGNFWANAAWLACAVLAHNLVRWTAQLGGLHPDQLTVTRSQRRKFLALPGRIVNRSGRHTLRMPARWPWRNQFRVALARLRAIPLIA